MHLTIVLSEPDAKAVFTSYGIPTVETHIARTPEDATAMADELGYPVALKILSDQISYKSDVGGVVLELDSNEAVKSAAIAMLDRANEFMPDAIINGFSIQKMASRTGVHELVVGITTDTLFGPVIIFGEGGMAVDIIADRAVALPPLNMRLCKDLMSRTRIYKQLEGYHNQKAANIDAICLTLMQISQLVIDIPEIIELNINPLFADHKGVLAVDTRVQIERVQDKHNERLAICPYPKELEEFVTLKSKEIFVRPIRPEDESLHYSFLSKVSDEDLYSRFFGVIKKIPHSQMARFTQIDYNREMAFIAVHKTINDGWETLGVVRTITDPNNEQAEYAILIRSDLQGLGLGRFLMKKMINYSRDKGTKYMIGDILARNSRMLRMMTSLGFSKEKTDDMKILNVTLDLKT